ncbi:heterokaryon incompatibility protein-domain-containing protein [Leptodontidium sp. MPI-SDFR-AT-0119]|nr:heterokaryon incompatibility protein-domain-containing protein [Leptodontidium sp. MPI-SDFR-AT-0119]
MNEPLVQTFISAAVPDYAILSHRWGGEELTLKDLVDDPVSDPRSKARNLSGFSKVQGACNQATNDGYNWIWIDSCCIDRSSSSELQEAINSMWNYYAQSNICYVYMVDVPDRSAGQDHRFNQSEWFTRGWTLQELIAPNYVEFYAADWSPLCTKLERYKDIAEITNIDPDILVRNQHVDAFSAAERLSWAAHRMVTREEDVAYSLLGLFQVNMPMLYGEGRERAFVRLQEAIYNSTHDHTLSWRQCSMFTAVSAIKHQWRLVLPDQLVSCSPSPHYGLPRKTSKKEDPCLSGGYLY